MFDFAEILEDATVKRGSVALWRIEQSHTVFKTSRRRVIHVDPFLSRVVKPENHVYPEPLIMPEAAYADFVFLTHDHRDHTDVHTVGPMARTNPKCVFIGTEENCARCQTEAGIAPERLIAMREGDERAFDGFSVRAVYARDTRDESSPPSTATAHLGYVFDFEGARVYHVGDTRKAPEEYADRLAAIRGLRPDAIVVAINEGYSNPGPAGAAWFCEAAQPRLIIPCHYDCFKHNTMDPRKFIEALPEDLRSRVHVLARGEGLIVERSK
ncbi:MAG: MBL fold metallo-hydrolase [Candidatus Sumerlaeota bacterium]|nr:MBL fold metallo-hydrolase [Candidatus Sumerlaeota bacterium]